jgi:hypothetical protein
MSIGTLMDIENDVGLRCRLYARYDKVNEQRLTYKEWVCYLRIENLLLLWHHHPADVDKQKEMVELTVEGLILPQVLDRNDDDFHRGGLKAGMGKEFDS